MPLGITTSSLERVMRLSGFLPECHIAVAVAIRSDRPGENYAGGIYGAQVANAVLKAYFAKKGRPAENISPR